MSEDADITPSCGNVFADLGIRDPEVMLEKARLVVALDRTLRRRGLDVKGAAVLLGISVPELEAILLGSFRHVALERLTDFLTRARQRPALRNGSYKKRGYRPTVMVLQEIRRTSTRKKLPNPAETTVRQAGPVS